MRSRRRRSSSRGVAWSFLASSYSFFSFRSPHLRTVLIRSAISRRPLAFELLGLALHRLEALGAGQVGGVARSRRRTFFRSARATSTARKTLDYDYTKIGRLPVDVSPTDREQPGGGAFYGALQAAALGLGASSSRADRAARDERTLDTVRERLGDRPARAARASRPAATESTDASASLRGQGQLEPSAVRRRSASRSGRPRGRGPLAARGPVSRRDAPGAGPRGGTGTA